MHKDINVNVSGPVQPSSVYKTVVLKGNHSFVSQVTDPNMKYIIKHDFDLGSETVTIPEGCLIEFDGGSVSNGALVGQDTILIYNQPLNEILTATLEGTWRHESGVKADEEDITDINGELKLKDRGTTDGMGMIILRKNKSFAEQLTQTNTIYEIRYDFNLNGETVTIPENCVLKFDGGSLSNGSITGQNTCINNESDSTIFDSNIDINGTWNNLESYLTWFDISNNDITPTLTQLHKISNKIILDKSGDIRGKIVLNGSVEIDGCGNTFGIYINNQEDTSSEYNTIYINNIKNICIHDIHFDYKNVILSATCNNYSCVKLRVDSSITIPSNINIFNVSITNFDNRNTNPCSWIGLNIQNFDGNNSCTIHDVYVENCIVLGDGVVGNNVGGNYPIRIQCTNAAKSTGTGELYNIHIKKVANCVPEDHSDLRQKEDTSGIYICAVRTTSEPALYDGYDIPILIKIHDCYFEDCSLRCLKLQGKGARVEKIFNKINTEIVNDVERTVVVSDTLIDFQGFDGVCDGFYGDVAGSFCCSYSNCIFKNSIINTIKGASILFYAYKNSITFDNCTININNDITRGLCYIGSRLNPVDINFINSNIQTTSTKNYTICCCADLTDYRNVSIKLINSNIDHKGAIYESINKLVGSLSITDSSILKTNMTFGYNIKNCRIIDSKIISSGNLPLNFVNIDNLPSFINIKNSVIEYSYTLYSSIAFNAKFNVTIDGLAIINTIDQRVGYVGVKFVFGDGVEFASLNNIYSNIKDSNNNDSFKLEFNEGAKDITVSGMNFSANPGVWASIVTNTTKRLGISWKCNSGSPVLAPYIKQSTTLVPVSDLSITGSSYVTYVKSGVTLYWRSSKFVESDGATAEVKRSGITTDRPVGTYIYVGFMYMDTTLGKPIYASAISGDIVTWVDATGATV